MVLAEKLYKGIKKNCEVMAEMDESSSIGRRYRRQDELGTPFCITVDFDTVEKDNKVTLRERDTTKQERVEVDRVEEILKERLRA